jgi:ferritin
MARRRTQANLDAERRYKEKIKRVHMAFHEEKDAEILRWLRSQVAEESEIPALIKQILKAQI